MKIPLYCYAGAVLLGTLIFAQDKPRAPNDAQRPASPDPQAATQTIAANSPIRKCSSEKIYHIGRGVSVPRVIYSPSPGHPESALSAKEKGNVVLSFVVASDGQTCNVKVDRHLASDLDQLAVEAVNSWRFQPALREGKPVAVYLGTNVDFKSYK
jgi:TonB family protein